MVGNRIFQINRVNVSSSLETKCNDKKSYYSDEWFLSTPSKDQQAIDYACTRIKLSNNESSCKESSRNAKIAWTWIGKIGKEFLFWSKCSKLVQVL